MVQNHRNLHENIVIIPNRIYVYGDTFNDWDDFGKFYTNLELNSIKSNLELAEIFLLSAIEKDKRDTITVELVKEKLKTIDRKDRSLWHWENLRKDCVKLWFKINH